MKSNEQTLTDNPWIDIFRLKDRLEKTKKPDETDVDRLRQLAAQTPLAVEVFSAMRSLQQQLIRKISHGAARAFIAAEVDALEKQLGYDAAAPLKKLLISQILTARIRLINVENSYTQRVVNESNPVEIAEYWDRLLSSAQARFVRAIEALARVRRLARNTPALQVSITNAADQQLNGQGDMHGQKRQDKRCQREARLHGGVRGAMKSSPSTMRNLAAAPLG